MSKTFNANMFDTIKGALEKQKHQGGGAAYKNLLSIKAPNTYIVRLLPNVQDPKETFFHYYHHGWQSAANGQYVNITSPSTWGDRCPISELYFKILRDGTEEEQERAKKDIRRKENWLVNVLVIDDPENPENNGTVKMLRYGRQINKIIDNAISGDDAAEFGGKIFDLSENGCNFRIKAELVSDKPGAKAYPTYVSSRFLNPSEIPGMTDERISEIYEELHDLTALNERKTEDEIAEFIDIHYYDSHSKSEPIREEEPIDRNSNKDDKDEDVPYGDSSVTEESPVTVESKVATSNATAVSNILDDLDDLDND